MTDAKRGLKAGKRSAAPASQASDQAGSDAGNHPKVGARKNSLTERAYQEIKSRILTAQYEPGQFLQENAICADIGIGRTPVHQALQRLMQEDLLEVIPRKGILIRLDSLNEIMMALEIRSVLEPHCAAKAAARLTAVELAELRQILDETIKATKSGSKDALMVRDRRFHSIVTGAAGNPLIADFLQPVHERLNRLWFQPQWSPQDFALTEGEHEAIYDALLARDPERASAAMREHIRSLHDRLLSSSRG